MGQPEALAAAGGSGSASRSVVQGKEKAGSSPWPDPLALYSSLKHVPCASPLGSFSTSPVPVPLDRPHGPTTQHPFYSPPCLLGSAPLAPLLVLLACPLGFSPLLVPFAQPLCLSPVLVPRACPLCSSPVTVLFARSPCLSRCSSPALAPIIALPLCTSPGRVHCACPIDSPPSSRDGSSPHEPASLDSLSSSFRPAHPLSLSARPAPSASSPRSNGPPARQAVSA
jgi:hypothetical protein